MRLTSLCLRLVIAAALGSISLSAFAGKPPKNIVDNGSFEANEIDQPWEYLSHIDGWTSTGPFEIERGRNAGGLPGFNLTDKGNQYLELDSTELTSISQDLHTTKGTRYDLSFDFSGRPDTPGGAESKMAVYWNGNLITTITEPAKSGWVTFSFDNLLATGKSTDLEFKALGPTSAPSYGNYLDNVVVEAVPAVPEASTTAMLAAGLMFIAYTARRRRS